MNPSIMAAWIGLLGVVIGVTGTAIAAWVGLRNTRNSTAATVAANSRDIRAQIEASSVGIREEIEADRRSRFWEKRAAAYDAILAAIRHRSMTRAFQFRMYRVPEEANQQALDSIMERQPPGLFETEGRLFACGSDDVLAAYDGTQEADCQVVDHYLTWKVRGEQREAIDEALKIAEQYRMRSPAARLDRLVRPVPGVPGCVLRRGQLPERGLPSCHPPAHQAAGNRPRGSPHRWPAAAGRASSRDGPRA